MKPLIPCYQPSYVMSSPERTQFVSLVNLRAISISVCNLGQFATSEIAIEYHSESENLQLLLSPEGVTYPTEHWPGATEHIPLQELLTYSTHDLEAPILWVEEYERQYNRYVVILEAKMGEECLVIGGTWERQQLIWASVSLTINTEFHLLFKSQGLSPHVREQCHNAYA